MAKRAIIPIACNQASADFMFSSPLMRREYRRCITDAKERIRDAQTVSVF
jgi:methylglyoxal synthase